MRTALWSGLSCFGSTPPFGRTTFLRVSAALALLAPIALPAQQVDVWSRPIQTERTRQADFIHYRVNLTFDLEEKVFLGENRITLTPFVDGHAPPDRVLESMF